MQKDFIILHTKLWSQALRHPFMTVEFIDLALKQCAICKWDLNPRSLIYIISISCIYNIIYISYHVYHIWYRYHKYIKYNIYIYNIMSYIIYIHIFIYFIRKEENYKTSLMNLTLRTIYIKRFLIRVNLNCKWWKSNSFLKFWQSFWKYRISCLDVFYRILALKKIKAGAYSDPSVKWPKFFWTGFS